MSKSIKRSKKAALILMVPTATLLLAGCGSEEPVQTAVYQNAEECAAFYNPPAECQAEFAKAQQLHAQVAPKYQSKTECETDFGIGNCETPATAAVSTDPNAPVQQQQQASSGFFMPMMMGFLAGQMLNRGGAGQAAPQKSVPTQPLYKSRDDQGTYRTASNQPVARKSGVTSVMPSQMQPKAGTVVRRGGFGAQAQQRQSMTSGG
ncbi:MAG: DUF1190 domain-containing protein [Gammaproteobacteria bacterium]|jgi:uncharacterized protein YgiB involved in biofilm formation|nr:DUF1190 domain-containing protein [Gammaproteobacteria bacterium]MBU2180868.1 DUF1190 domain-containing protein [Gammaproteobacteria bacterium]MBU2223575.1 DUF1190 domain-containing protein [Gammaproteobacteria bacterium]MBU2278294.1 DUF1190 domain-containing protein [Gammaproteobacteria bacterium]MBU2426612.1 DUF1190 domain-containing protein [Gammaproteobacteria bacterium]